MERVGQHFRQSLLTVLMRWWCSTPWLKQISKPLLKFNCNILAKRLAAMDMQIEISDAALGEISNAGFDPVYGARPLKRAIQSELENPLSREILAGNFAPKDTIKVDFKGGKMVFTK